MKFAAQPSAALIFVLAGEALQFLPSSEAFQWRITKSNRGVISEGELRPAWYQLGQSFYARDDEDLSAGPDLEPRCLSSAETGRRVFLHGTASAASATFTLIMNGEVARAEGFMPDLAAGSSSKKNGSNQKRLGGMAKKIRSVCNVMDELQRDLMQERWDLIEKYPEQLRSYVPIFTTFTDSAFPSDEVASDKGLRVALRYEVGRFFASLERLRRATGRRNIDEAYVAYSDMSLHLDRYMHVGGLYTYYDDMISTEEYFKGNTNALVHADPLKDPALVRDLIVLIKGPDMGKTGIVIGLYPDGTNNCVVKLDKYKGMREIRVVPQNWAAKRLGEQDPDEVFLIPRKNA